MPSAPLVESLSELAAQGKSVFAVSDFEKPGNWPNPSKNLTSATQLGRSDHQAKIPRCRILTTETNELTKFLLVLEEWIYRSRWLEPRLSRAVEVHPVVVVIGPRQVGKSTSLRHMLGERLNRNPTSGEDLPGGLVVRGIPRWMSRIGICPRMRCVIARL